MFKKLALVAAIAATSSFASWDLFPILEKYHGEVQVGATYMENDYKNATGMYVGERFSVFSMLELGVIVPCRFYTEMEGIDNEQSGIGNIATMARLQFTPHLNMYVDVDLPTGNDSYNRDEWTVQGGAQFSMVFNSRVNFGSQLGVTYITENDYDFSDLFANAAVQLDFTVLPQFTPFLRADVDVEIGWIDGDGFETNWDGFDPIVGTLITAGTKFSITDKLDLEVFYDFGIGDHYYGPYHSKEYGLDLLYRF